MIAEGVETLEQDAFIRHEECDLGQGYLYGKPITAIQFEQAFIHKKSINFILNALFYFAN